MDKRETAACIGERIREVREEHSMSMNTLGDVLGVTHASISRYESGIISPRRSVVEKIAHYVKISPLWILGLDEDKYLPSTVEPFKIPILYKIILGVPVTAQTDIVTYYWVPSDSGLAYGMIMPDDSMINARIHKNDVLLIRAQTTLEHNDIALVVSDGQMLVRKIIKVEDVVILHPENPAYQDIVFAKRESHEIRVMGIVKTVCFEV